MNDGERVEREREREDGEAAGRDQADGVTIGRSDR